MRVIVKSLVACTFLDAPSYAPAPK